MTSSSQLPLANNPRPSGSSVLPPQPPTYAHHLPSIPPKKSSVASFALPQPRGGEHFHPSASASSASASASASPSLTLSYANASPAHSFGGMVGIQHSSDHHPSMTTPMPSLPPLHPLTPFEPIGPPSVVRASSPAANASQSSHDSTQANYRPLNVRDALTYLDLVKVRFSDQPDVYNRFLDIMKDFKSQSIDTPGVIERVSTLFKGHPNLVSGFNTFLPPGYRIECSKDPREPDLIHVTTPGGITTTTGGSDSRHPETTEPPHGPLLMTYFTPPSKPLHQPEPPLTTNTTPTDQSSHNNGAKRPPIEFNHAINYVNKIKNRFASDPDTYKQFLEILQMYQKDEKAIQDVYSQVQYLFNGSPDLLHEFKLFLPDVSGQNPPVYDRGSKRSILGPPQNGQAIPPGKKKKMANSDQEVSRQGSQGPDMIDRYEYAGSSDPNRPSVSSEDEVLFEKIRKHIGNKPSYEEFLKTLNLYSQQIVDMNTLIDQVQVFLGNNKKLFDAFKSMVGYEPTGRILTIPPTVIPKPDIMHCKTVEISPSYRAVPKSWQNQPCSGRDQLCWEVLNDGYVSHPIWASEDSGFVTSKKNQYEEALHRVEEERYDYDLNIEANHNVIALLEPIVVRLETMTPEEKSNLRLEPGLGGQSVSIYTRIIKKVYEKERAEEIIEMLYTNPAQVAPILLKRLKKKNEEWIKAQYEWNGIWRELDAKNFYRALDYQGTTFKSNDRKVIVVKSLVTEIETMHHNQQTEKSTLQPKSNYQFLSILDDPDVFKDITRLVFTFIENQGGFTNNDREKIRTFIQTFIPMFFHVDDVMPEKQQNYTDEADDEIVYEEDEEDDDDVNTSGSEDSEADVERERANSPNNNYQTQPPPPQPPSTRRRHGRGSRNHQEDEAAMGLLRDVLTKNTGSLTTNDAGTSAHVNGKLPSESPDSGLVSEERIVKTEVDGTEEATTAFPKEDPSSAEAEEISDRSASPLVTATATAATTATTDQSSNHQSHTLFAAAAAATAPGMRKRTAYNFFCNSNFYCLFRLYEMLYERLLKMKKHSEEIKANPRKGKTFNKMALDLGFYSHRFEDIDLSGSYYAALLGVIDRFFEGELDQTLFEESARYIFVTEAYTMFTIDKLVLAVIKQIQAVTMDVKSVELVKLFRSDQSLETVSPRTLSVYRLRVEDVIGSDENLYKVNFNTGAHVMTIQLLGKDEYMLEPTAQDQYEDYVASYMCWSYNTEGIDTESLRPSFLQRNLEVCNMDLDNIYVRSKLQYKISQESYHMFYIIGSEDLFVRPNSARKPEQEKEQKDKSVEKSISNTQLSKWQNWLQSPTTGWSKDISNEDERMEVELRTKQLLAHGIDYVPESNPS
ncbi:hypothetical protein PHYBLDRAFT_161933 [Phycomyces blakesleeanus NRRL 1555(-)]|uniref:Histone deacetylase interacting domain-containing protein n=1 Tax=Phycomyces blakesleeanus (strain ATCC 8743b / DSM 1359 / FGSC 10004 / NBRC 33097 / NRRL 1555) TaxID=763407 RepID=A0A163ESN8_PHYB8|nr:hypothetical protein PHYBLDRAFT_161933 [Phycomyces blakesleeanus NRRL 1555(-)]OAD81320.1 hypothetical protein PHYBLDRAFT_161933 [Phycomyces blakesleeanus NRRL 1555(-)]|eukprot:XP_018299360.1 hypothetical protein PHYBLDRAFT_161933 [Phycomyces blakesleeanus NRRL 1555(-)]